MSRTMRILDVPPEPPDGTVIEYDDRVIGRVVPGAGSYDRRDYQPDESRWFEYGEGSSAWWTWGDVVGQMIDQAPGGRYVERGPVVTS